MIDQSSGAGKVAMFPNFEITPESDKQKASYCIRVSQAIIDKHNKGKTSISPSWKGFFQKLRDYGAGRQDPDQYKSFLSASTATNTGDGMDSDVTTNSREVARKGWMSVDWTNLVSPVPNLKSLILGAFSDLDYDVRCDTVDVDSGAEEEMRMLENYVSTHPVYGKLLDDLKTSANIPIEAPEFIPDDLKDAEDIKQNGGYKSPYIQSVEKLLFHTESASQWDRFLKQELINDTVDIGYLFAEATYSDESCTPVWEYCDPQYTIMQYDHDNGFKNSDYAARRVMMTISQLKQYRDYIRDINDQPINEEGFKSIARAFYNVENSTADWAELDKVSYSGMGYDSVQVPVWRTYWIDVNQIKRIKYTNKYGKQRIYDYKEPIDKEYDVVEGENSFDYPYEMGDNYALQVDPVDAVIAKRTKRRNGFNVIANKAGKIKAKAYINIGKDEQVHTVRIRKLYHCWYIENTGYAIKFGPFPNQPRYEYNEPMLPIVGYRYPLKSIVYRCVPIVDMYNKAWLRLQNALAKATSGVYTINTTLLDAGGKKLDPLKVLKAMRENQVLFYRMSATNIGGTPIPLSYVPGNLQEAINSEMVIMNNCMKLFEDMTGFSMLALGATPDPKQLSSVMSQSLAQTNKSLQPILTGIRYIKEELAKRSIAMWDLAVKNEPKARAQAVKIIGQDGVFILEQARNSGQQLGIHLVARPDEEMKRAVLESATISFQNKEITSDERLFIIEQVSSGQNLREIRLKLRKMIQKNRKIEEMYKQQAITLQGQQIKEQAAAQAQSAERIAEAEIKAKATEIQFTGQKDIAVREHDSLKKREEMAVEAQLERGQNTINKPR
jgi:hypothetical protein